MSHILDPLALWGIQGMSQKQAMALIAAAPALRLALKKALGYCDDMPDPIFSECLKALDDAEAP